MSQSHRPMLKASTLVTTAATSLALVVPTADLAAAVDRGRQPTDIGKQAAANPWRAGGLMGRQYFALRTAMSGSGVWVAIAMRPSGGRSNPQRGIVVRRSPNGDLSRYRPVVSSLDSVDVDPGGNITVVGSRHKRVVAITWRRAERPRIETVFDSSGTRGRGAFGDLLTNRRGDAAIITRGQDGTFIVRRSKDGQSWRAPAKLKVPANAGTLDDLSMQADGRLLASFLDGTTVNLRRLRAEARTFTAPRPVLRWPAIADDEGDNSASLTVGPRGTVVVALAHSVPGDRADDFAKPKSLLSPCEDYRYDPYTAYKYRYVILRKGHAPFTGAHGTSVRSLYDDPVIGIDGSVTVHTPWTVERWSPDRRVVRVAAESQAVAANPRGDMVSQHAWREGRRLSIWRIDRNKPYLTSKPPHGEVCASEMTNGLRAYVVSKRDGRHAGYYLNIGRITRR